VPELRKDPIIGRWVIIATERGRRPQGVSRRPQAEPEGVCPFCPGQEDKTPPEVYASGRTSGQAGQAGWRVRVVPNRYPALMVEGDLDRHGDGIYDGMQGVGAHEVIIETPDHARGLPELTTQEVTEVLLAYRARILDLRNDHRLRYILLFKNHGAAAGATLAHSHSQLIALPVTPRLVVDEIVGAKRHFEHRDRCIFCDIVGQERKDKVRLVYENEAFVAVAPYAPKAPFETWILGKRHASNFELEPDERLAQCADALRATLGQLDRALEHPAYNFIIHTNPLREPESPSYHWHVEIRPALTQVAGFEWGSGFYINPVPPEEAADYLRKVGPR
jgi:UDPglucose--hexose-1-phosphate uridylyltransferase